MSISRHWPGTDLSGGKEKFGEDSQTLDRGSKVVSCEYKMRVLNTGD